MVEEKRKKQEALERERQKDQKLSLLFLSWENVEERKKHEALEQEREEEQKLSLLFLSWYREMEEKRKKEALERENNVQVTTQSKSPDPELSAVQEEQLLDRRLEANT
ncbi:hypothetical protein FKM82_008654 [Ascaphus truei]